MHIKYTEATIEDADAIARLHAESWKLHYRGLCPDDYLDNKVDDNRQKVWSERLTSCLLYTSPSPRDQRGSRMPSSA